MFRFPKETNLFISSVKRPYELQEPTQPFVSVVMGGSFPGGKATTRDSDRSPSSSIDVENELS